MRMNGLNNHVLHTLPEISSNALVHFVSSVVLNSSVVHDQSIALGTLYCTKVSDFTVKECRVVQEMGRTGFVQEMCF